MTEQQIQKYDTVHVLNMEKKNLTKYESYIHVFYHWYKRKWHFVTHRVHIFGNTAFIRHIKMQRIKEIFMETQQNALIIYSSFHSFIQFP
uniref:Uncharacterized protein n=1 Tax=Anguilla anguilla TaxID=7936 RepID=A0A0E9WT70_ANGAN